MNSFLSAPGDSHLIEQTSKSYSRKIIVNTILLIISGAIVTGILKYQTMKLGLPKDHVSLQTFFVFFAQFINLLIFFIKIVSSPDRLRTHFQKYKNLAQTKGKDYKFKSWMIFPSSFLNCIAVLCQFYALFTLSSGMYQMFFGFGIIFAPFLSSVFLKRSLYPHIIFGIGLSVLSMIIVLVSSYLFNYSGIGEDGNWFPILLMIFGVFLNSCQKVYQEYIYLKIEMSPFRYSGMEGLYSSVVLFTVHLIMLLINKLRNTSYFDIGKELVFWFNSDPIVISSLVLILCFSLYDLLGISLVNKTSASYRVTNEIVRVILLWISDIILYDSSSFSAKYWINFSIILVAYGLLIYGNLIINEIVEVKIFGLNKYFGLYRLNEENASQSDAENQQEGDENVVEGENILEPHDGN